MFDFLSLDTVHLVGMILSGLWTLVLLYLWRMLKDGPYLLFFALQAMSMYIFNLIAVFIEMDQVLNMVATNASSNLFLTIALWMFTGRAVRKDLLVLIAVLSIAPTYLLAALGMGEIFQLQAAISVAGLMGLYFAWMVVGYCRKHVILGYQLLVGAWILHALHSFDFTYVVMSGDPGLLTLGFMAEELVLFLSLFGTTLLIFGRIFARLEKSNVALVYQANTDALTGVDSRAAFIAQGQALISSAERYERPVSAIMLDLDHFKKVNDTLGHAAGDMVLKAVGNLLKSSAREADVVGRLGGEEFAILLPEATLKGASAFAEKLRKSTEALVVGFESKSISVTVSAGVSILSDKENLDSLLARADKALYAAKEGGRNRVEVFEG